MENQSSTEHDGDANSVQKERKKYIQFPYQVNTSISHKTYLNIGITSHNMFHLYFIFFV